MLLDAPRHEHALLVLGVSRNRLTNGRPDEQNVHAGGRV